VLGCRLGWIAKGYSENAQTYGMGEIPRTSLPKGEEMPMVGVGTWNIHGETLKASVRAGIDAGCLHVDTAEGYGNEEVVGEAIAAYDREELFLTSKVLPKNLAYESVIAACRDSLSRLGTDYLDLYLIHWPNPAISLRETLAAMATLHEQGRVRNVGVSNFTAYQLSCAHHVSDVPIAVNQIEFHPRYQQPDVVEYCRETDTVVQAAAPLGRTAILEEPLVRELAEQYDRSPARIALRWAIEHDVVVLPKSSKPERVMENVSLFDFSLAAEDLERLDALGTDEPVYDTPARDWSRDRYGISE
jgi:diketogulonate reductase-like aldo/keto reductase